MPPISEMLAQWNASDENEAVISWVREFQEAMAPYATGGEYINNQTVEGGARVAAAYRFNYDRHVSVKQEWGPAT
jgi:hypothetical protein